MKKHTLALLLAGTLVFGTLGSPAAVGAEDLSVNVGAAEAAAEELMTDDAEPEENAIGDAAIEEAITEDVAAEEMPVEPPAEELATDEAALAGEEEQQPEVTWTVTPQGTIEILYTASLLPEDLRFAVWSAENSQDDLTWTSAEKRDAHTYVAVYDPAKLKHYGTVYVHAYTGTATYLGKAVVDTGSPSVGEVKVEDLNQNQGTCRLVISDFTHPELIRKILVPTWSDPKQADIVWYEAEKQTGTAAEDLVYTVPVSIAKHKNNLADYQVHVYMTDSLGKQTYQVRTSFSFALKGTVAVSETDQAGIYQAKAVDTEIPGGAAEYRFAVWSAENGQDDLKWLVTKEPQAEIRVTDFKHKGLFHVHCYVTLKNGSLQYLNKTTFTPVVQEPVIEVGPTTGSTVQILLKNYMAQSGIRDIRAAVWSRNNGQDDLKWYSGTKQSDGSWKIPVDMGNHKDFGDYDVHVYMQTTEGKMVFVGKTDDLKVEAPKMAEVTVSETDPEEGAFSVKVVLPEGSASVGGVTVPVWCAADQSDIKWYEAARQSDGSYQVTVKAANHKNHTGTYQVHVYARTLSGQLAFIGRNAQEMKLTPVSVLKDQGDGRRTVLVRNCSSAKEVLVPVWSNDNGQDDLIWYPASKNASGAWQVTIDAGKHRNAGLYHVHVYADGAFAGNANFTMEYSEVKTASTELAKNMKVAENEQQLILVAASGTSAQVTMLNKNSDGSWFQLLSSDGYVGINGVGPTTEWNRRTPPGVFGFTKAFGIKADPGTAFDYVKVDSSWYWVDDVNSKYYNQFVTTRNTVPDWSSAEHIIDYTGSYNYCLAIDYNPECTPGVGSAIFLHCSSGMPTGGCVSVPESIMKKIMQLVRTDCKIVIDSAAGLANY